MTPLAWIIVGLASGFMTSSAVDGGGPGLMLDMILGAMGSFVTGAVFGLLQPGDGGPGLDSVLVSVAGAVVVLVAYHAVRPQRAMS